MSPTMQRYFSSQGEQSDSDSDDGGSSSTESTDGSFSGCAPSVPTCSRWTSSGKPPLAGGLALRSAGVSRLEEAVTRKCDSGAKRT